MDPCASEHLLESESRTHPNHRCYYLVYHFGHLCDDARGGDSLGEDEQDALLVILESLALHRILTEDDHEQVGVLRQRPGDGVHHRDIDVHQAHGDHQSCQTSGFHLHDVVVEHQTRHVERDETEQSDLFAAGFEFI